MFKIHHKITCPLATAVAATNGQGSSNYIVQYRLIIVNIRIKSAGILKDTQVENTPKIPTLPPDTRVLSSG